MAWYCSFDTCILFILSLNYHFLLPLQFFKSKKRHTANFYIWHFLFLPYSSYVWRKFFFEYFLSTFMSRFNKFIFLCLLILNVWTSASLVVMTTIIEIVQISTSIWLKMLFLSTTIGLHNPLGQIWCVTSMQKCCNFYWCINFQLR